MVSNIFIFTPTWGNDPIWRIFFKWVETLNQPKFLKDQLFTLKYFPTNELFFCCWISCKYTISPWIPHRMMGCNYPPKNQEFAPKTDLPKKKVVFHVSFFRCELLVSRRVLGGSFPGLGYVVNGRMVSFCPLTGVVPPSKWPKWLILHDSY